MGQGQSSTSGRDAAPPFEATPLDDPTANDGEQEWPLPSSHYDDDNEDSSFLPEPDVGHVGPMRRRPRLSPAVSSSVGVGSSNNNNSSAAFQSPTLSRWNAHRDVPLQAMVNANETDACASHSWDQQRRTPPALVTPTATAALRAIHRVSNPPLYPDIPEVPEEASDFDESGSRVNVGGAGEELAGNESSSSGGNLPPPRPLPSPLAEALMMGLGRSGSTGHSSVRRASDPRLPELGRSHQEPLDTIEVASPPRPHVVARGSSWTSGQVAPPTATLPLFADEGADANLDPYEPTPQLMPSEDLPTPYGPQPSVYGTPAVVLDSDSPVQGTFPWLIRSPPPDQPQAPEASDELRQQAASVPPSFSTHAPAHGLGLGSPLLLQPPPFTRAADPSPLSSSSAGDDSPKSSDEAMSQAQRPTDGSLKRKAAPAYVSQLEGESVALQSPSPPTPVQDASTDPHAQGAEMSRFSHSSASDAAARSEVNHLRAGPSVKRDSSLIQDLFRPSRLATSQQQRGSSGAGRSRTSSFFSRFTGRARKGSVGAPVAGLPPTSSDADAASSLGEPPVFQIRPRQTSAPPEMGSLARRLEKAQRATMRGQEAASHKSPRLTATQHTVGGSVRRVPSFAGSHGSIRSGRSARSARGSATSLRQAYTQQEPAAAREGWEDIVEDEGARRQEAEQEQSFKVKRKRVPLGVMFGWPRRGSGSSKQQQLHRNDVEALHDPRAQMQRAVSEPPPRSSNTNPPPVVQKIEEQHQQQPPGASAASLLTTPHYASSTSSFSSLAPPPAPQPVPPKRPRRPRRRTGSGSHSDSGRIREPQTAANAGDGEEITTPIWDDSVQSINVPAPHSPRGTLATIHSVPWRQDSDEGASRIEILHSERGSPLPSASNRASTSTSDLAPRAQSKLSQSYLEPESGPSSRATPGLTQKVSGQTFGVAGASEDHSRPSITQESTRASPPLQPPSAPFAATTRASPPTRASLGSLDSPRLPSHLRHAPEGSSSSFTKIAGDDEREENVALRSRVRVPSLAGSDVSKLSARGQLSSSAILAGEAGTPIASAAASSSSAAGTPRGMPFPLGGGGHRRVASGSAASGRLSTHLESPRQRVSSLGGAVARRPLPSLPTTARPPVDGLPATNDDATSLPLALRAGNHRGSWNSADGPWAADIVTASAARAPTVLASIPQGRATAIGRQRSRSSMHPRTEPLEADERSQAPAEASAGEAVRRMRSSSEPVQPRVPASEGDAPNGNAGRWSPVDYDQVPKGGVQASLAALAALEKERRGEEFNEPTTSRFLGSTLYALPPRASRRQAEVSSSSSSLGPPKLSSKQLRERQEAAAAVAHLSGSRLRERAAPYERRRPSNAGGYSSSRDGYSSTGTSTLASLRRRRKQRSERHAKDWTGMAFASSDALEDHTSSDPMTTTADEMQRRAAYQALRRSLDTPRQRRDGRLPPSVAPGLRPSGADSHARHRSEFVMPGNAGPRVPTDRRYQELRREDGQGVWQDLAAGGWQHYVTPPRQLADQAAAALRAVASGAQYEAEGTSGYDRPQHPSASSPIIVIQSSRSPPQASERLPGNTQSGAAGSELIISSLQQQMRDLEKRLMDEMARSKAAAGAAASGPSATSRPPLPPLPRAATTPAARRDTTTAVPHPTIPPLPTAPSPLLSDGLSPHLLQQHEDLARRVRDRERDAGADMVPFPVTSSRPSSLLRARRQHERRGSRGGRYEEELAAAGIDELGRPIRSRFADAPVSRSLPLRRGEGGEGNAYPSRHRDARAKTYGSGSRRDEHDDDGDPGPSRHRRGAPRRSRGQSERQWEGEVEDDSAGKYYEERAHRPADAPRPSHRRRRSSSSSRARATAAAAVAAKAQSKAKARVPSTSATSIGTGGSKAGYARGDILAWQKGLVVEEKDGDGDVGNGRRMGEGIV